MRTRHLLLYISSLFVAGCGLASTALLQSGIEGIALAGPQCAGPQPAVVSPDCEDKPVSATVVVYEEGGLLEVTRFTTGADGRFRVPLAPGVYRLDPQSDPSGFPFGSPQTVTVTAGGFTDVTIRYDTGLR